MCENAWEAVVERAIYEKAQEIAKERWKDTLDNWAFINHIFVFLITSAPAPSKTSSAMPAENPSLKRTICPLFFFWVCSPVIQRIFPAFLLREGFSVDIAENALEEAGAETIRNTNIWFINVLPFPLQIIRNVSGR